MSVTRGVRPLNLGQLRFEDDFNENAKVAVDITVDKTGNVTMAVVNQRGTTTTNQNVRNIALRKARSLKLNSGNTDDQTGTLVYLYNAGSVGGIAVVRHGCQQQMK